MHIGEPRPTAARRTRTPFVGVLVVVASTLLGVLVFQMQASVPVSTSAGATTFDEDVPGVTGLDPSLRDAVRSAADRSAREGIEMVLHSGWRSPQEQEQLLLDAIATYGSRHEAARWVATPDTSAHVSGDAVDIGPSSAAAWLDRHGAAYGLCRIYGNEPWHFELRPEAVDHGCPAPFPDPTHDPRMQP
jgi:zinc D-Ala-D-Ala carboxypeptidase